VKTQPTFAEMHRAMPVRFRAAAADWSTEDGNDCKAIRGEHHMFFFEKEKWVIQEYTTYSDHSVGIFGQEEPGDVVFATADPLAAMKQFIVLEADLEADDFTSSFAEWLGSAEYAEENA
jgi:hypothetical protein